MAFRETATKRAIVDYCHGKPVVENGAFARVKLAIEPRERGAGVEIVDAVQDDVFPQCCIVDAKAGVSRALESGVLGGYPVIDIRVAIVDGACRVAGSSRGDCETAAFAAAAEGLREAGPLLLEQMMRIEVNAPDADRSKIIADLRNRRGEIIQVQSTDEGVHIVAMAPLDKLVDYFVALHRLAGDAASFKMTFDHYAASPIQPDDPTFPSGLGMRA